jgi:hypothetical protein
MESEAMNVVIPSDIAETTRTSSSSSANNLPTLSGIFFLCTWFTSGFVAHSPNLLLCSL